MAAENFKVKKGLEVGTGATITSGGVNVTGIITAVQFKGDGSGLTNVVGSGSGVVVKDEGSAVGTAGTINFVGTGVVAALSAGIATVTISSGGLTDVVDDATPELGGNLDLNNKFVTGSGGINVTGVVTATTFVGNGDFVDIDVDGQTELDDLNVAGVSTFGNNITASGTSRFEIASMENGVLDGEISHNGDATTKIKFETSIIKLDTAGTTRLNINNSGAIVTGISTFSSNIDANGNLDVDGQTDLDDVVVAGVSTFNDGITLGTNSTTFAAKFADNAVANFGTDNDLQVSHDNSNALIRNSTGKIVVVGVVSATSGAVITGVVTATTFSGSGASLTSLPSGQLSGALPALDGSALTGVTASGSGVVVKHDGSTVGTAGTINFSTNLDVTAVSAGIVTITASGGTSLTSDAQFNTVAGTQSGDAFTGTDATRNTLYGYGTGTRITSGDDNTHFGYNAGSYITSNFGTTFIGARSGEDATGMRQTGLGFKSLYKATGTNNVAVGYEAGAEILAGSSNVCIGYQAGDAITSGSNNIVFGNGATASAATVSNEMTLGNSSITKLRVCLLYTSPSPRD